MLKFLSTATLIGAAIVLTSGDASASFFRKKKKGCCAQAPVAAPCCGAGAGMAGYRADGYPSGQYYAGNPALGTTSGYVEGVPMPMPSVTGGPVIQPSAFAQPTVDSNGVIQSAYTQPYYGAPGAVPTGYAHPIYGTSGNSGSMRLFRR